MTRRKLATAVLSSAAASALAQTQPAVPATPDDELKAARARMQANTSAMARQAVPAATEPAFRFIP